MTKPEIMVKRWVNRGEILVNTECLDFDDPDHIFNQIISQGGDPEKYGYKYPLNERFEKMSRSELIMKIVELERELNSVLAHI